ncbi:MAG: PAS domain S-box protein [Candidatus Heimdallarchaeota archaeon]|nr:MAG: PAS domain S-box protein [Candidatus Heimdallarchaeota archaeon]
MDTLSLIEEQSQFILDNIRDIIFSLSSDGMITSVTKEFEKVTGWSREEWIGKHFLEIVHPEDTSVVVNGFEATIDGETVPPYEARIFGKSGDIITLEAKSTPQVINGQITGYLGIARDITERKQSEELLRSSEQQYRTIIESLGDPLHVIDRDFVIILANPAFSEWLKELNFETPLVGKTIREAFPFLSDLVLNEYHTVFSSGQTLVTEEATTINGKKFFTETRKIPILHDESVVQVITIIRDITERTHIEEQLRESEKNYRELISNLTDVVAEVDEEGKFIFVSPQIFDLFGYKPRELIGKNSYDFIHPNDIENAFRILTECLSGKQRFEFEYRIKHNKGHYIWVTASGKAIEHENNLKIVFGIRNITDQKRMKKAVQESEEKYRTLFENIPIGLYRSTPDHKFLAANPAFLNLVGLSSFDELIEIDSNHLAIIRKYPRDRFLREIEEKGEVMGLEFHLERPDGSVIHFRENARSIKDKHGKMQYYEGSVEDITDRINAQKALFNSEERLRSFMDGATDSFSLFDSDLNLIDINKTGLKTFLLGIEKTEVLGRNITEFHTNHEDILRYKEVLKTGIPYIAERVAPPQNYGDMTLSVKAFKVGDGLGIVAADITDRKNMENALRKSEERLRRFMDAATDSFTIWDSEFNLIDINKTGLGMLPVGTKKEDIIGKNIEEFDKQHLGKYEEVLRTGKPYLSDRIFRHPLTGERIVSVKAFKTEEGLGLISTDITKRKIVEDELRSTKFRLEYLLKSCPAVIYSCTPGGHFSTTFMSENIKDILGYQAKSFIDTPEFWEQKLHPDEKEQVSTTFKDILEEGNYSNTYRFQHKKGSYRWMLDEANLVKDEKGKPLEIVGFWSDITDYKRTEEALRESEEKFRSVFENSPLGIALTDLNFSFTEVNDVFKEMLGYQGNELTQRTILDITHEEHRERDEEHIKKLLNNEISSFQTEKRYLKKNEDILWVRVALSLLKDDKGNPLNFLLMVEDITAIKQREEELKKEFLKYKIQDGNVYLITEEVPTVSKTVFSELTTIGYKGFVASRTPNKDFRAYMEGEYDFFWLTEEKGYNRLINLIKNTPSKSVILIDRLEYLFLKEGLENAIQFVYKLKEITYLRNLVVILSIDSATISERELLILEKETHQIEPRFMAKIAEEYLEILRFVYQQNNLGLKPSYSGIGEGLKISRPTVRKRIKQLILTGYLHEHKKGKSKIVEISGKGRMLFLS